MKTFIALILLFLVTVPVFSQSHNAWATLPSVDKDGFYQVKISPSFAPYISESFSNVRVIDSEDIEIPYVLKADEGETGHLSFIPYPIKNKIILKDSCTILVLENGPKAVINNITLQIKNADVNKVATLAGSDDTETWYALKQKFQLGYMDNQNGTATVTIIDFPNSNYKYYRLWIDDQTSPPLNVLNAGYYQTTTATGPKYSRLPDFSFTQTNDSQRKLSVIKCIFDTAYFIDKITWSVSGSRYFYRNANLYTIREHINRNGRTEQSREFIQAFQVNSRQQNVLYIPQIKTDNVLIEVENLDNPALKIDSLRFYQLDRYLTVFLQKRKKYRVSFGSLELTAPVYDLAFFRDSIPASIPVLEPGILSKLNVRATGGESDFFTSKTIVWTVLICVIAVLGFMSLRMIKETSTNDK